MNLVAESNGTSARRGRSARSVGASSPAFAAMTTRAASVGSPMIPGPSGACGTRTASEHNTAGKSASVENSGVTTRPPEEVMVPSVPYPPPSTNQISPPRNASRAVIWFSVSVPVLSEQITDVDPSVSTECKRFTMAFCFAIFEIPIANVTVTTAGRPSGMAATARATAPRRASLKFCSMIHWITNTMNAAAPAIIARVLLSESS